MVTVTVPERGVNHGGRTPDPRLAFDAAAVLRILRVRPRATTAEVRQLVGTHALKLLADLAAEGRVRCRLTWEVRE